MNPVSNLLSFFWTTFATPGTWLQRTDALPQSHSLTSDNHFESFLPFQTA